MGLHYLLTMLWSLWVCDICENEANHISLMQRFSFYRSTDFPLSTLALHIHPSLHRSTHLKEEEKLYSYILHKTTTKSIQCLGITRELSKSTSLNAY